MYIRDLKGLLDSHKLDVPEDEIKLIEKGTKTLMEQIEKKIESGTTEDDQKNLYQELFPDIESQDVPLELTKHAKEFLDDTEKKTGIKLRGLDEGNGLGELTLDGESSTTNIGGFGGSYKT